MRKTTQNKLPLYKFHLLEKFDDRIGHAVLSREGGVSKPPYDSLNVRFGIGDRIEDVAKNRAIICKALDLDPENLVSAEQTHSKNVAVIEGPLPKEPPVADKFSDVDASITALPGYALMMQVADCQAQLMYDPVKGVAAAVHAGWKGLARDIAGETLKTMKRRFHCDPKDILVGIAPSLGPCCAYFSDPEKELPESFRGFIDKEKRVNLWEYSLAQLQSHGIAEGHIELARVCTQCNNGPDIESRGRFYSFRGEKGITGRFGVMVWLR